MALSNEKSSLVAEKSSNKVAKIAYGRLFGYNYTENTERESLFYREIFRSRHIISSHTRRAIALPKF